MQWNITELIFVPYVQQDLPNQFYRDSHALHEVLR